MSLWQNLVRTYGQHSIEAPGLKIVTLAQWALESNFGKSKLAKKHLNFGGLKYRARVNHGREGNPLATAVDYEAHDGDDTYCAFASLDDFINGYWAFIDNTSIYEGWRNEKNDPSGFISHLKAKGYAEDPAYVSKVMSVVPRIRREIEDLGYAQLFSAEEMFPGRKSKIAIIRGHNENSKGAYSEFLGTSEWDFNGRIFRMMQAAANEYELELREFLRPKGMPYEDEIAAAYSAADAWEPRVILETHFNSVSSPSAQGCEMLYWATSKSGRKLAESVQNAVLNEFKIKDRGLLARSSGRGSTSLRASRFPTILTEPFFGSSEADCAKLLERGPEALARAYLIGIRDALNSL